MSWQEAVELAQDVTLLVCLVVTGAIFVVGLVYVYDRSSHVAASPREQAHDARAERAQADPGHAPAKVHGLPARRDARDEVADRAPHPRRRGWAHDVRELRAGSRVLPVVSEEVQPVGGRAHGRGSRQRSSSSGAAAAVAGLGPVEVVT